MRIEKKVSVIIPTYNRASTIKRALNSVLNQTYKNIEVIIVDDCSTDDTYCVIKEIEDPRVIYIKLEENMGACEARNCGIERATGDYIAFQDSDDYWHPKKLSKQIEVIEKKGADVCYCSLRRIQCGRTKIVKHSKWKTHYELCSEFGISTQTIVAKRDVFSLCKFDNELKRLQDYEWGIRASRSYAVYFLREELVDQYLQPNSLSNNGDLLLKNAIEYIADKHKIDIDNNYKFKAFIYYELFAIKKRLGEEYYSEKQLVLQAVKWKKLWVLYLLKFLKNF